MPGDLLAHGPQVLLLSGRDLAVQVAQLPGQDLEVDGERVEGIAGVVQEAVHQGAGDDVAFGRPAWTPPPHHAVLDCSIGDAQGGAPSTHVLNPPPHPPPPSRAHCVRGKGGVNAVLRGAGVERSRRDVAGKSRPHSVGRRTLTPIGGPPHGAGGAIPPRTRPGPQVVAGVASVRSTSSMPSWLANSKMRSSR